MDAKRNAPRLLEALPAQEVPFPVEPDFAVRPDLRKLDPVQPVLVYDAEAPRYLADKFERLRASPQRCLAVDHAALGSEREVLELVLTRLSQVAPRWVVATPAGWQLVLPGLCVRRDWTVVPDVAEPREPNRMASPQALAGWLASQPPAARIAHAIGLGMQEDWVVMRSRTDSDPTLSSGSRAEWLHVCFPSGWSPADKVGRPLAEIHRPVADGHALRAASESLSRAMTRKGPFVRHVWTLASSDALARDPHQAQPALPESVDAIQFRCERQVTLALAGAQRSLFLIRVYVAPVAQVAADPARRAVLVSALRSMSDAVIEYKAIGALRDRLLREWGPAAAA